MMLEIVNVNNEVVFRFRSELERFTLNEKFCLMEGNHVFFGLDSDNKPLYARKPKSLPYTVKMSMTIITEDGEEIPFDYPE